MGKPGRRLASKESPLDLECQTHGHSCNSSLELTLGSVVVARAVRSPAGTPIKEAAERHGGGERPLPVRCSSEGFLDQDLISIWVLPEHSTGVFDICFSVTPTSSANVLYD